ncbi:hypothetical protein GC584_09080 [Corynebacterium sp. zg912]|uniref:DUF2273 domain-containing protein n=1 Tax=Corynebacterium wankanglinii TaxID=2735136 RepID=A0A7H0KAU1_9CORY|nr:MULTISPECIES: hypothetical protein [Corynebacterium]MBA1836719.1 hypothetical protein [Corynebacterium wankanglinii]MCR5929553.1 hypothetical protein [Corynebacterium sp. zg912]QNP94407.1 hypothetical protein IA203_02320 [Corynebacterium wankanglinii]
MNLFSNKALAGIIIGAVVAFFVTFGGWPGLLWLLLFTIIGGVVGAQLDGRLDLSAALGSGTGRGRS